MGWGHRRACFPSLLTAPRPLRRWIRRLGQWLVRRCGIVDTCTEGTVDLKKEGPGSGEHRHSQQRCSASRDRCLGSRHLVREHKLHTMKVSAWLKDPEETLSEAGGLPFEWVLPRARTPRCRAGVPSVPLSSLASPHKFTRLPLCVNPDCTESFPPAAPAPGLSLDDRGLSAAQPICWCTVCTRLEYPTFSLVECRRRSRARLAVFYPDEMLNNFLPGTASYMHICV